MALKQKIALFLLLFFFGQKVSAQPKIFLSFPESFSANKEIEIFLKILNLENKTYDLKIGIEKEKILSEIFNEKEKKWQSSNFYLKKFFSGPSFNGNFKLRLKKQYLNFEGEANILVRVRESGKSNYFEFKDKIKILKPEDKIEVIEEKIENESLASLIHNPTKENFLSTVLVATFVAIFFGAAGLILKLKLEKLKNKN